MIKDDIEKTRIFLKYQGSEFDCARDLLKDRDIAVKSLDKALTRLTEIDIALSNDRPELAQEVWKHSKSELILTLEKLKK